MSKLLKLAALLSIFSTINFVYAISVEKLDGTPPKNLDNKPDGYYLNQMQNVFKRIKEDYVQEPNAQEMTDEAIDGMLKSLDPYSGYYTGEDLEFFKEQAEGEFGGIGIEFIYEDRAMKVITPIDDLPAFKAGIEAGDYIVGVNGRLVSDLGFNKAVRELRGKPGTSVNLLIVKSSDNSTKEVEIVRELVKIKPIKYEIEDDPRVGAVSYIRVSAFNAQTTNDLKKAMKEIQDNLKKKNQDLKGIVLDLRNNPGGLLDQAVQMCEYFLEKGNIVSIKGRSPENQLTLSASIRAEKAPDVPMVVLINSGSASAAEIVAGALQDYKRAILIGVKSFGKGLVQSFMELDDRSGMKLTTAKYYTPNGRSINGKGIVPDIEIQQEKVEFTENEEKNSKFTDASIKSYLQKYNKDENEKNDNGNPKDKKEGKDLKDKDPAAAMKYKERDHSKKDSKKYADDKDDEIEHKMSDRYKKDYQYARAYDVVRGIIVNETSKRGSVNEKSQSRRG